MSLVARSVCGNMTCPNVDNLKTCTRCKSVAYCSVACQTADWRARHKKICSPSASLLTEQVVKEDMEYLREVMKGVHMDQMVSLMNPANCFLLQHEGDHYSGLVLPFSEVKRVLQTKCSLTDNRLEELEVACSSRIQNYIYVIVMADASNVRSYTLKINKQ